MTNPTTPTERTRLERPFTQNGIDDIDYSGTFNAFARAMCEDFVGAHVEGAPTTHHRYLERFFDKIMKGEGYTIQFMWFLTRYLREFRNSSVQVMVNHDKTPYYPDYTWGMRTRAYEDALYVTDAIEGSPFKVGQKIVYASIYAEPAFRSVPKLRKTLGTSLYGADPERELWDPLLHFVNRYLVEVPGGNGEEEVATERVTAERLTRPAAPSAFELHDAGDALVLTLRDLTDAEAFAQFIDQNRAALDGARKLVVDVRHCSGGDEYALLPLLPSVVAEPTDFSAYLEETCLTNYTKTNVQRQSAVFDLLASGPDADGALRAMADALKAELEAKSGSGLVEEPCAIEDELRRPIAPRGAGEVRLLTDVDTCDAAELLAEVCADSPRAVTVGRATRGSRGYFNPAVASFSYFTLQYPISRFTDEGLARHHSLVGLDPQVHVPWTPEFCERDPDMEAALAN